VHDDAKTPILQQVTEIIVLEIQKTFDFFRASAAGEHIEKIYLAGGSAKVPGLVEALRQNSQCRWSCSIRSRRCSRRLMGEGRAGGTECGQLAVAVVWP